MTSGFVPDAGDIVWLNFDPQAGHEQAGHRPALVISAARYNGLTGMMLCCPLTTSIKGYPFEVPIAGRRPGVVLSDQIKNLDWRSRGAKKLGMATKSELAAVRANIRALIG